MKRKQTTEPWLLPGQLAEQLGVTSKAVQEWMSLERNPLPHENRGPGCRRVTKRSWYDEWQLGIDKAKGKAAVAPPKPRKIDAEAMDRLREHGMLPT